MAKRFQDKYRIDSARKKDWDYGWNAVYFVTICTKDRQCFFGDIRDGEMQLSEIGKMVESAWEQIPERFPFAILDAFVVMPNHFHGLVAIHKQDDDPDTIYGDAMKGDAMNRVSTDRGGITGDNNPMLHQNLSNVVRWFKGHATFKARQVHADFSWQPRFHDHIVRNQNSLDRIRHYILNNPATWEKDVFFPNAPA